MEEIMDRIVLEGKSLKTKEILHQTLKDKLELPEYYGKNLDALWDCLTSWVDVPLTVVWNEYNESEKLLGSYASDVVQVFKDAESAIDGFKLEIK